MNGCEMIGAGSGKGQRKIKSGEGDVEKTRDWGDMRGAGVEQNKKK